MGIDWELIGNKMGGNGKTCRCVNEWNNKNMINVIMRIFEYGTIVLLAGMAVVMIKELVETIVDLITEIMISISKINR